MLVVPESLRAELRKPLGKLMQFQEFADRYKDAKIISVGDVVTISLLDRGIRPFLCVYDFRSMRVDLEKAARQKIKAAYPEFSSVPNPPGTITDELEQAAKAMAKKGGALFVDGEEDLAALVFIKNSPSGCVIIYGQPSEGVVAVECNNASKKAAGLLLGRMEKKK